MESDDLSEMIFAEIHYTESYRDMHFRIVALMENNFPSLQSGLQSDSWIWIGDGAEKVAIDTFTSMKHQVKSENAGLHVQRVIDALRVKYDVTILDKPREVWD